MNKPYQIESQRAVKRLEQMVAEQDAAKTTRRPMNARSMKASRDLSRLSP